MNSIEFSKSIRLMLSGAVVEISNPIPILPDGRPLGIPLDGSIVQLNLYPSLYKFIDNNSTSSWYRCDSNGVKRSNGRFIRLPDVKSSIDNLTYVVIV